MESICGHTRTVGGKTLVCLHPPHPDEPKRHWMRERPADVPGKKHLTLLQGGDPDGDR